MKDRFISAPNGGDKKDLKDTEDIAEAISTLFYFRSYKGLEDEVYGNYSDFDWDEVETYMCSSNTQDLSSIYTTYISNNLYDMRTLNYYPLLDRIIEWLDQEYGDNLISQEAVRLIEKMAEEHYREWKANASED